MKELIMLFVDDLKEEGFTLREILAYGCSPLLLVAGCMLAEWIAR